MKTIKYFFEFLLIIIFFIVSKIIGYKNASNLGEKIGITVGPFLRSNYKINLNLKNSDIGNSDEERNIIIKKCGEIMEEY